MYSHVALDSLRMFGDSRQALFALDSHTVGGISMSRAGHLLMKCPVVIAAVTTGVVVFSSVAYANYDDGTTTITTSFTREPHEQYCYAQNYCTSDFHFPLTGTCSKIASSRLRFQRDALPDQTEKEYDNFTTCTNYYWDNFRSESTHGHHMDGKVTSGTGREHFFYTDEHSYN